MLLGQFVRFGPFAAAATSLFAGFLETDTKDRKAEKTYDKVKDTFRSAREQKELY